MTGVGNGRSHNQVQERYRYTKPRGATSSIVSVECSRIHVFREVVFAPLGQLDCLTLNALR